MELAKDLPEGSLPVRTPLTDAPLPITFATARRRLAETTLDKETVYQAPTSHFGLSQALHMVTRLLTIDQHAQENSPSAKALLDAYAMEALARQNDQLLDEGLLTEQHPWGGSVIGMKKEPARGMSFPHSEITYMSMPRKDGKIEEVVTGELLLQTTDMPRQLLPYLSHNTQELLISVHFSDFMLSGHRSAMDVRIMVSSLTNPRHKPIVEAQVHANFHEPLVVDHILTVGENVPENPWEVDHS